MKLTYKQAVTKTTEFLTDILLSDAEKKAGNTEVTIHDFYGCDEGKVPSEERKKRPWVGVRVAEVSVVTNRPDGGMHGGSYMQSDYPYGAAICRQVEFCILSLIEDWNDGAEAESDEEFHTLKWMLVEEPKTRKKK